MEAQAGHASPCASKNSNHGPSASRSQDQPDVLSAEPYRAQYDKRRTYIHHWTTILYYFPCATISPLGFFIAASSLITASFFVSTLFLARPTDVRYYSCIMDMFIIHHCQKHVLPRWLETISVFLRPP